MVPAVDEAGSASVPSSPSGTEDKSGVSFLVLRLPSRRDFLLVIVGVPSSEPSRGVVPWLCDELSIKSELFSLGLLVVTFESLVLVSAAAGAGAVVVVVLELLSEVVAVVSEDCSVVLRGLPVGLSRPTRTSSSSSSPSSFFWKRKQ